MQFIKNGPDIPESLLQAHEDGRVVFFCGAGISYPAGLPGFQGLVDQIYSELGATRTPIEEQAYYKEQYDATLDLLERRIPGQRATVRDVLAKVLQPNLRKKGATTTHAALLQLARDRNNNVRLVTTNFDRIFLHVMARIKPVIPSYPAPLLPIPKNSRWNGVVYLHGLLPKTPDESALNRLVVSSGDFGLAYLTERWAARFVSELFRNYIICFVGYSINDPVLRYMMDALAADKMLGELTPQAYAFGDYSAGAKDQGLVEWEAKGVTPVLYEVPSGTHDHSALHRTLKEWADTHRDGVLGKERIVAQYAVNPPMASTREDNFIGRILWAISDKSSLPAKRFADLDPVPPLAWLEPLTQGLFKHNDLSRFDVPPKTEKDDKLTFSLVRRPAPYTHAPWMALANAGGRDSQWDDVMTELANWLLRHLDDPNLVLWIAKHGGQLHSQFARMIGRQINYLDKLDTKGKHDELDRIRASAPAAIPRPIMRTLWRLLLSSRVKSYAYRADLYDWMSRFKQHGLTPTLRLELREILSPRVSLSEPFRWDGEEAHNSKPERIGDLVSWEVVLNTQHPHSALRDWQDKSHWQQALPELLQDFSALLRDTLDLNRELGGADDRSDHSFSSQPSISDHSQNNDFHDWTVLIELTRDAWLATVELGDDRARLVAEGWWHTPYPVFKRLAFFAAAQGSVISSKRALEWLFAEDAWWLWSDEVRRETIRLLVTLSPKLNPPELTKLERAILKGPPRQFEGDIEPERWSQKVDSDVWLRLAKIQATGATLGTASKT
ncbi:MAG: SIR2 family protein, partial [Methylococcales bacterium]|nr:SIR2 family protein [Methylococcales bacterium]